MNTRYPYRLGVSLPNAPRFFPTLRTWRYATDFGGGFRFLEASEQSQAEEFEVQDSFNFNEVATAILGLVEPIRLLTAQELEKFDLGKGWAIKEDIEPYEAVEFVNRFGQIGLGDYLRLTKLQRPFTVDKGELTPEQAVALLGIPHKYLNEVKRTYKSDPKKWRALLRKIQSGDLIPFSWIEKDLRDLAKCVRILLVLDKNYKEGDTYLTLPHTYSRKLRRFLVASEMVFLPKGKGQDYDYRPLDKKVWDFSERQILARWKNFAFDLNRFLTPITFNAVSEARSEMTFQKSLGVETWLIYEMLKTQSHLLDVYCARAKCRKPFIRQRNSEVARYCSPNCSSAERNLRKRARDKKNSSGRSQKKAKAKGKKRNA
jgi:hypothetical protein